jgi:hypothetical protein
MALKVLIEEIILMRKFITLQKKKGRQVLKVKVGST